MNNSDFTTSLPVSPSDSQSIEDTICVLTSNMKPSSFIVAVLIVFWIKGKTELLQNQFMWRKKEKKKVNIHVFLLFPPVSSSPGACLSKDKQLSQSPTQLLVEPNRQVNLTFTHNITNYDTILWYQRSQGDTSLKLIAYVYFTNLNVEKPFEGNFQVSGDGRKTVYLHILNPRHPEDSGEYFGAARIHSYKDGDALIQKPSSWSGR